MVLLKYIGAIATAFVILAFPHSLDNEAFVPTQGSRDYLKMAKQDTPSSIRKHKLSRLESALNLAFGEASGPSALLDYQSGFPVTYRKFYLVDLGSLFALVAGGDLFNASHPTPGQLGIWYFSESSGQIRLLQRWILTDPPGAFGVAPQLSIRFDFGKDPVVLAYGETSGMGETSGCTEIIALASSGPAVMNHGILTLSRRTIDASGPEPLNDYRGWIEPTPTGSVVVHYRGTPAGSLTYIRQGHEFVLAPGQIKRWGC